MNENIAAIQARIAHIEQLIKAHSTKIQKTPTPANGTTQSSSNFASVLKQATSQAATNLRAYKNDRIPTNALVSIGSSRHKLTTPAAKTFNQMRSTANAAGVNFNVNDSYRSYEKQVEMTRKKGIYSKNKLAAVPNTSEHGLGISVDLKLNSKTQQWMNQNAKKYGFVNNVTDES